MYAFTEEEVTELLGDDLSLAASLARLINDGGDIRQFLIEKLEARQKELATFHLSQTPKWADDHELKRMLGIARSLGLQVY